MTSVVNLGNRIFSIAVAESNADEGHVSITAKGTQFYSVAKGKEGTLVSKTDMLITQYEELIRNLERLQSMGADVKARLDDVRSRLKRVRSEARDPITIIRDVPFEDALNDLRVQELLKSQASTDAFIFLSGGASDMAPEDQAKLLGLFDALRFVAERSGVKMTVGDGGTRAGIMETAGLVRKASNYIFDLIGIAPQEKIKLSGEEGKVRLVTQTSSLVLEVQQGSVTLDMAGGLVNLIDSGKDLHAIDPNHSHIITVKPRDPNKPRFGDETKTMGDIWGAMARKPSPWLDSAEVKYEILKKLTHEKPSVNVLANGGGITLDELKFDIEQRRPTVLIKGSGRAADVLVDMVERFRRGETIKEKQGEDAATKLWNKALAIGVIQNEELFEIFDMNNGAEAFSQVLDRYVRSSRSESRQQVALTEAEQEAGKEVVSFFQNPSSLDQKGILALADRIASLDGARLQLFEDLLRSIAAHDSAIENAPRVTSADENNYGFRILLGRLMAANLNQLINKPTIALEVQVTPAMQQSLNEKITADLTNLIGAIQLVADPALRDLFTKHGFTVTNINPKAADAAAVDPASKINAVLERLGISAIGVANEEGHFGPELEGTRVALQLLIAALLASQADLKTKMKTQKGAQAVMEEINKLLFEVGGEVQEGVLRINNGRLEIVQSQLSKFIATLFKAQHATAVAA